LLTGIAIAAIAILLRVTLPFALKAYVNDRLVEMGPYSGRVEEVDVALLRAAYTLHGLTIVNNDAGREIPFLDLPTMDISVQWRALLSGELVGEIVATAPVLNLVRAETAEQSQLGTGVNWPDEINELFPFKFNRVAVVDGKATFLAPGIDSTEALEVVGVALQMTNLTNIHEEAAAANGRFEGYLKSVMQDLKVFDAGREHEGPFRKAWEARVRFGANIFENRQEEQVATRIPYSGEFDDPDIGTLAAIVSLIRNAFVRALSKSLENTIDIEDVAGDTTDVPPE
jgi:hypothetical protein